MAQVPKSALSSKFPDAPTKAGMYESFYLRAVSPEQPVGAWIRYTVHKRPNHPPEGSLWCTVFDVSKGAPFMHRHTTAELAAPAGTWIEIGGDSRFGPGVAEGTCGPAHWSLRFASNEPELRHFKQSWLYGSPLPRTKLTSPLPAATFDGTIELPGRTLRLDGWHGMIGHNWGAEHAARWIWLHGIDFGENSSAWIDVALGRVLIAGRLTPWIANGAIQLDGQRIRLGGLGPRGVKVAESATRCSLVIPGEGGVTIEAHANAPAGASANWRYEDPSGGERDVVNCSVAALGLNVRPSVHNGTGTEAARPLRTAHGAVYELGTLMASSTSSPRAERHANP